MELNDEENNDKQNQNKERTTNSPIEFLIEKHRNGATGSCSLNFIKQVGRFVEPEDKK